MFAAQLYDLQLSSPGGADLRLYTVKLGAAAVPNQSATTAVPVTWVNSNNRFGEVSSTTLQESRGKEAVKT